ncbi:MAG: Nif3-like dinuclear metal center hexameric protein [Deltaproteobacteria bacterium]|nr:Nif3-like dinuclear metal center hexameric protein [Deltaproteobacteria bacterium]
MRCAPNGLSDLDYLRGSLIVPQLKQITDFLDKQLAISDYQDSSHNGLQVENRREIKQVCCGVDASMEFFQAARAAGANLLICHHGLSWDVSLKRITGLNYERVSYLIGNDMALYACHLPLDAHPRLGNNAQICKALGLVELKPFGVYTRTNGS